MHFHFPDPDEPSADASDNLMDILLGCDPPENLEESRTRRSAAASFPDIGDDVWPVSMGGLRRHAQLLGAHSRDDEGYARVGSEARTQLRKDMVVSAYSGFPKHKIPIRVPGTPQVCNSNLTFLQPFSLRKELGQGLAQCLFREMFKATLAG